jgi:hypothetical protein
MAAAKHDITIAMRQTCRNYVYEDELLKKFPVQGREHLFMNKHRLFWGLLVILLGIMLLLNTLGILTINAWQVFWPLALILVGGWLLLGPLFYKRGSLESQNLSLPLDQASGLYVKIKHGAGRLHIGSSPIGSQDAVSGTFVGGVEYDSRMDGNEMKVKLNAPADLFWNIPPFGGFQGLTWDINLNRHVPLRLKIDSGASESNLDLTDLKLSDLDIDTGASSTQLILPANGGLTRVKIHSGAASVQIKVPDGVAAHFEIKQGMAGINVDSSRFLNNGGVYETAGFAAAANRIEAIIETGVGAVEIH